MENPDTIVLIHGVFVTARSWERWVARYTEKGSMGRRVRKAAVSPTSASSSSTRRRRPAP